MEDNIFLKDENQLSLKQYMNYHEGGRKNLGDSVPIAVYRMLESSIRKQLEEQFGKDVQKEVMLTVAEDADCSGLPLLGETVCNYDEGFISGILSSYMGKQYEAVEINCWATGDGVCRFQADIKET